MEYIKDINVGDRVWIPGEVHPYKVRCRGNRYIICTKPMNVKKTVLYFILDLEDWVRGPDNMIFCSGYESDEDCAERLKELEAGEIEVSHRNRVRIDIVRIMKKERKDAKT